MSSLWSKCKAIVSPLTTKYDSKQRKLSVKWRVLCLQIDRNARLESRRFLGGGPFNEFNWKLELNCDFDDTLEMRVLTWRAIKCDRMNLKTRFVFRVKVLKNIRGIASETVTVDADFSLENSVQIGTKIYPVERNSIIVLKCDIYYVDGQMDAEDIADTQRKLVSDLKILLESGRYSDVTLKSGGKEFAVHRAILSARCQYFESMFEFEAKKLESTNGNDDSSDAMSISDVDAPTLEALLEFLYTGNVLLTTVSQSIALLTAAHMYQICGLSSICERFVCEHMSSEYIVEAFIASHLHESSPIMDICMAHLAKDRINLEDYPGFEKMKHYVASSELLMDIVNRLRALPGSSPKEAA